MILFVIVLLAILMVGIKRRNISDDALDKRTTTTVNGFFVLLVFLSHSTQYLSLDSKILNHLYLIFQSAHNQLVVSTFLAFSGYGVMEQIKTHEDYLLDFPRKRILNTLIRFDIAVMLYLMVNYIIDKTVFPFGQIILSLIGWSSVGNSNWYIFTIMILYCFTWLSSLMKIRNNLNIPLFVLLFSLIYIIVMTLLGKPRRFISTVLCYSFGMLLSQNKSSISYYVKNKKVSIMIFTFLTFCITFIFRKRSVLVMNIHAISFVFAIVLFLYHYKLQSKFFYVCGQHTFSIFILQRIPMMILSQFNYDWYIFVPVSFTLTILLCFVFEKIEIVVNQRLIKMY